MKLYNFISNCRHPKTILTKSGEPMVVPCGSCPDCVHRKGVRLTTLATKQGLSSKYVVFATLTYNDVYVPVAKLCEHKSSNSIRLYDVTRRPLKTPGKFRVLSNYRKCIHVIPNCNFEDELFQEFYKKSEAIPDPNSPRYSTFCPLPRYTLRYCHFPDVRNFFKRLRFNLSQAFSFPVELKYLAVSEYGPETFRPHFHVMLFFDSRDLLENIVDHIRKAWSYGLTHTELADDPAGCSKYLASYCNSAATLPYFLAGDQICPCSSHSKCLGSEVSGTIRDFLYENPDRLFNEYDVPVFGGTSHYSPTRSNLSVLLPRCYNFEFQTPGSLYEIYTSFSKYSEKFKTLSPRDITRNLLASDDPGDQRFLRYFRITRKPYIESDGYAVPTLDCQPYWYLSPDPFRWFDIFADSSVATDYEITAFNRVYSQICMSKRFIKFNCANLSPEHVLSIIRNYYKRAPLFRLRNQYDSMIEYNKETGSIDYSIFFHNGSYLSYEQRYRESSYIKKINKYKDKIYHDFQKKKIQNDKNGIFVKTE